MTEHERERKRINKKKEMRTKEISKMISEGGLGSDNYYDIEKDNQSSANKNDENDEENKARE